METKIKGASIRARLRFLDEQGTEIKQAVLNRLSAEEVKVLTGLLLAPNFYPLSLISNLDEAIALELNPGDKIEVYRRLGQASAEDNLTSIHSSLAQGEGPHDILERYPSVRRLYYSDGVVEYERLGDQQGQLTLTDADVTEQDNESTAGYFQRAIELMGGTEVSASVESASRKCVLMFSWS